MKKLEKILNEIKQTMIALPFLFYFGCNDPLGLKNLKSVVPTTESIRCSVNMSPNLTPGRYTYFKDEKGREKQEIIFAQEDDTCKFYDSRAFLAVNDGEFEEFKYYVWNQSCLPGGYGSADIYTRIPTIYGGSELYFRIKTLDSCGYESNEIIIDRACIEDDITKEITCEDLDDDSVLEDEGDDTI